MFKTGSVLNRRDTIMRPPTMDVLPCEKACTRHLHVLPPFLERPPRASADIEQWLEEVEKTRPMENFSNEARMPPTAASCEVPTGVGINNSGSILLRIGKCRMSWRAEEEGNNNYQLLVKFGNDFVLSCPTGKSGTLQDYFLLNLVNINNISQTMIDIIICPIENAIEQRVNARIKSIKAKATELFRLKSTTKTELNEDPMVRIPLSALLQGDPAKASLNGCFFITSSGLSNGTVLGDISISAVSTKDAFPTASSESSKQFQNYLTILKDSHHWHRVWAMVDGHDLHFCNFQRRDSDFERVDLTRVTLIDYHKHHECGTDNVVKITFDNDTSLLAYADDEKQARQWTNVFHRAVWNQPYEQAVSTA